MTKALRTFYLTASSLLLITTFNLPSAHATDLSPALQVKLDIYKTKLAQWAKDPEIIKAVIQANKSKPSMSNKTWETLTPSNARVQSMLTSQAGKKLSAWDKDKSLGKLFLRDGNGNFIAGSKKPAIYNIANRPAFSKAIRGKIWNSKKPKADPTTKLSSIQLSTPVKNAGKEIGVLHTSILVN